MERIDVATPRSPMRRAADGGIADRRSSDDVYVERRATVTSLPSHASAPVVIVAPDAALSTYSRIVKPVIDRTVAALVLLVLAIPMLVIAAAVAVSVGRPVIFRQERVGRDGKRFSVYKFRTMHHSRRQQQVDVPEDRRRTHKSESDPRLTGVGKFLRKWSLDELPQFINVVKGDMSLIGPRPELPSIVDRYPAELHVRHAVKPGLTGLWQVSARGDGLMHEHGEWDIEYARTISPATDLKILVKTPAALLGSRQGF